MSKVKSKYQSFDKLRIDDKQNRMGQILNPKQNLKAAKYIPLEIEERWQTVWERYRIYQPDLDKAKKPFYNLMMFPYPSAQGLHVGNMYAFTGSDVYGRFMRMRGYDVFEPIGLDGFGIHSENYAIKVGRHPKEQAKISEANFYRQLRATGNGFDWSRKLETYDPKYYKWTQWLFIQLFKAGLAYRKKAPVNFCPSCKTVLADEQVIQKLKAQSSKLKAIAQKSKAEETVAICERCGTEVYKKELEQWFFRITKYADTLLENIDKLNWTEKVKIAQKQWIGRSDGLIFTAPVKDSNLKIQTFSAHFEAFRADTFVVIAPDHPLLEKLIDDVLNRKEILDFCSKIIQKRQREGHIEQKNLEGIFTGKYIVDPVGNGDLPVWVADYAIKEYGTGIVKCSAHDERDFAFAKKYGIRLKPVLFPKDPEHRKRVEGLEECYTDMVNGYLTEPDEFARKRAGDVRDDVIKYVIKHRLAEPKTQYHLHDWLISRQRYWGPPIPMIYCSKCAEEGKSWFTTQISQRIELKSSGNFKYQISNVKSNNEIGNWKLEIGNSAHEMRGWFPVPEEDLPVLLPDVKDWKPLGTGKSPLDNVESFVNTKCPNCKGPARRETDVSDTFLDSSWYFLRYLATEFNNLPFPSIAFVNSKSQISNSKQYQNSNNQDSKRFDRLDFENSNLFGNWKFEIGNSLVKRGRWLPVSMYIGGAEHSVLHLLYSRFITMALHDLGYISFEEPFSRFYAHGLLIKEGAKMSKSKGNVVVPDDYIRKFGADTLRCYLMFLGPFNQGGDFYDTGIEGMYRFVKRLWCLFTQTQNSIPDSIGDKTQNLATERLRMMHKTIKKVTEHISSLKYNTAIAALMEWHNFLKSIQQSRINSAKPNQSAKLTREELETFLKLLAPFAPHVTEEIYQRSKKQEARSKRKIRKDHYSLFIIHYSIHAQPWPKYDPKYLEEEEVTIVVQVNGKVRDSMKIKNEKLKIKNEIEEEAKKSEKVGKHLKGKRINKVVYVEGKVINFVTK